MAWIAAASGVIKLIELGINLVERSKTTVKGHDKAELARDFAAVLAGQGCQQVGQPFQNMNDDLDKAIKNYQSAYVTLQNELAKANTPN